MEREKLSFMIYGNLHSISPGKHCNTAHSGLSFWLVVVGVLESKKVILE